MIQASLERHISINEFWYILLELQTEMFSGTIELNDTIGTNWKIYFYLGRLVYATGGKHPVRRWIRHVKASLPQISLREDNLWKKQKEFKICWEYELLSNWHLEGKIKREQVIGIINGLIKEVFGDLHRMKISKPKIKQEENSFSHKWLSTSLEQYINQSREEWRKWQEKGIADLDPEKRPIIRRVEELASSMPSQDYQKMVQLFNSQLTLRELSVKIKKPVIDLTISLLPYLRSGIMEMVEVEDWPVPESKNIKIQTQTKAQLLPLVACIDDSFGTRQPLDQLVEKAGCKFVGIQDPIKAIPFLVDKRPALILLDTKISATNSYRLCEVMRKMSVFKTTPMIIFIEEDSLISRVRAKMAGATECLVKPVRQEIMIKTLLKYVMLQGG